MMSREPKRKLMYLSVLIVILLVGILVIYITKLQYDENRETLNRILVEKEQTHGSLSKDYSDLTIKIEMYEQQIIELNTQIDLYSNYEETLKMYTSQYEELKVDLQPILNLELCKPKMNYDQAQINQLEGSNERNNKLAGLLPIPFVGILLESAGETYNKQMYQVISDTNNFVANHIGDDLIKLSAYINDLNTKMQTLENLLDIKGKEQSEQIIALAKLQNLAHGDLAKYVKDTNYDELGRLLYTIYTKYWLITSLYESLLLDGNEKTNYVNDVSMNIINLAGVLTSDNWDESVRASVQESDTISETIQPILEYHAAMLDTLIDLNAPCLNLTKKDFNISTGFLKKNKMRAYIKNKGQMNEYVVKIIDYGDKSSSPVAIYYNTQNPFKVNYEGLNQAIYLSPMVSFTALVGNPLNIPLIDYWTRALDMAQFVFQDTNKELYLNNSLYKA